MKTLLKLIPAALAAFLVSSCALAQGTFKTINVSQTVTLPTASTITNNGWNEASGEWKFTGNVTLLGATNALNGSVLPTADTGAVLGSNTKRYTQLRLSDGLYIGGSSGGAAAAVVSTNGTQPNQGVWLIASGTGTNKITGPLVVDNATTFTSSVIHSGTTAFSGVMQLPSTGTISNSGATTVASGAWDFLGAVQFNNASSITSSGANATWTFGSSSSLTVGATALILNPSTGTTSSSIQNTAGGNLTISTSAGSVVVSSASKITLAGSGSAGNAAVQVTGSISPSASTFLPNVYNSGNSTSPWAENHAGHYCADVVGGNAVSISAAAGSGSGATASISGNDACGNITVNTGTGTTTGFLCQINFGNTYSVAPMVVVGPVNGAAQAGPFPVVDTYTTTTFKLSTAIAWPASATLIYRYMVMQGP